MSSDDDFNFSSDIDLGEGDSADDEAVNDSILRQVNPPNESENEMVVQTYDIESDSVDSSPTTSQTIRKAPASKTSRKNYTWLEDKTSIS